ncbi:recombination inhibitory protein MutS2 [Gracilibacillus boraciitolerans JCM 21714]|uniref:Recombination inhibitory protein MutS2 n=1 Tax=Gracilibacillus boraciitolerans JCM 21714 TaxID=1298598 RepID=W4VIR4_9BACI|nr:recombination inhibitory protein MutS2 [Gracilibacillus boraciitolerans JCM 21714]
MNQRILHVLEFHKIKEQLVEKAASSLGVEKARMLKPSTDLEQVNSWQDETDEAFHVIRLKGNVPLGGISDIKPSIKRAVIGGILSTHECLDVASTINGGKQLKLFIDKLEDIKLPIVQALADEIVPLNELEREIKSCIDDHGHMMMVLQINYEVYVLRSVLTKIRCETD